MNMQTLRTGLFGAATLTLLVGTASSTSSVTGPSTGASDEGPAFAVGAKRVHVGDGTVLENAAVVVVGGKIQSVAPDTSQLPDGLSLIEHDGDLSAGLIALHDYSGAVGENRDRSRTVLPEAELYHAYRPGRSDFEKLVHEGITAVVLAPPDGAIAGGITAVVKTHGGGVLKRRAHLGLGLSSSSLAFDRYPTSYAGALGELESQLAQGAGSFGDAASGALPVAIRANGKHEIRRAVAFAKEHGLKGAIVGASRSGELAEEIAAAGLAVVYRPYALGMEARSLRSVAKLAEGGVLFGFGLEAPYRHAASLRLGAAACVREGLDPAAAWRALTSDAAKIAGVGERVGTIAAGKDADLVLWSGTPLDLGSEVVAVYVDGERVHGGEQ